MNIAICDDEKVFIEKACMYIMAAAKKHNRECSIQTFNSGDELVATCIKYNFDAVFLDIAMPQIDGFEVAKRLMSIRRDLNLIFVSSKEYLVFSSYEYNPLWFVPKSQMQFFETAVDKLVKKLENEEIESRLVAVQIEKNRVCQINLKENSYIKSDGHYLNIYNRSGDISESYRYNLNNLQKQLEVYDFIRCHESYLVNCRMISCLKNSECILLNGEKIPVSRRKMVETKKIFQKYLRGMQ